MQTVGQILKEARAEKLYSLEEVEKATKIRKELLEALEADNYTKLPPQTFVQGFIKNYAKFLNLDSEKLLAIFRRGFEEKRHTPKVSDAFSNPIEDKLKVTPGRVLGVVVGFMVLAFFVYLWFQYRQFVGAPPLELVSPQDQMVAESGNVVVEGKTNSDMQVLINNQKVDVDEEGRFRQDFKLSAPANKIIIAAIGKFGKKTEIERTVYLKR